MAWQLPTRAVNPPIRVDDEVIFWDGSAHKLSKTTLAQLERGERVVAAQPQIDYWGWQPPR